MEALRTQIIETQKVRSDLMKWKLFLVAGLGGTALALNPSGSPTSSRPELLLALIPFVCVYVDALCAHLSLRITAIGDFLAAEKPTPNDQREHDYEAFLRTDTPPFRLETLALHWSTILMCVLVGVAGFIEPISGSASSFTINLAYILSGVLGLALTLGVWAFHRARLNAIKNAAERWKSHGVSKTTTPDGSQSEPSVSSIG